MIETKINKTLITITDKELQQKFKFKGKIKNVSVDLADLNEWLNEEVGFNIIIETEE